MGLGDIWKKYTPAGMVYDQYDRFNQANDRRAAFDPYSGQPGYPEYTSNYLSMTGDIKNNPGLKLDPRALDKFNSEALRNGPSNYANMANKQNQFLSMGAKDAAKAETAGATAEARAQLASKRGLSSGAAQNLAESGRNKFLDMSQGVNNQTAQNAMTIGMNDEKNRISQLGQANQMNLAALGPQFDQQKLLLESNNMDAQEGARKNKFNLDRYGSQMSSWAASKQAQATQNSGKK